MAPRPDDEPDRRPGPWNLLVVGTVVVLAAVAWWVVRDDAGPIPPFLGGARPPAEDERSEAADGVLDLAGSGSNLPITRALAAALPGELSERPVIHDSIGSGGGVRALLDGAVELALVSRPLSPRERELGLVDLPYARVPVVVAVNASVPDRDLSGDELVEIFAGRRTTWSDGSPVVVLQREPGDSSHRAVDRHLPRFAEVNAEAWETGRFRVLYHDDAMRDALAATPGAIGLFGQGAVPGGLPIRTLRVDGVAPRVETVESGDYPFAKDLVFVSRGPPTGAAVRFVAFAHAEDGREIIRRHGGLRKELAARLGPLAVLLVLVIGVSAPLAVYVLGRRAVRLEARAAAKQVAHVIVREVEARPRLWKYDTLKLLVHLRSYAAHEHIERIEVVDAHGELIDDSVEPELPQLAQQGLLWESAEIGLGDRRFGEVWVGANTGDVRAGALRMLGLFGLLGAVLGGLMYALPRRAMALAEQRIGGLLARLQRSQTALAESANSLEQQVEARSSELSRALRELQDKEQRVRELSTRAVSMQEAERRAIARELHDSAGQALTAIRIHLQLMGELIERLRESGGDAANKASDLAARTATMVDETLEEIRRAVNTLGPAVLDDVGLTEAITRACDDLADALGIEVEHALRLPDDKLPPVIETTCYRVVQEAFTNISRHAEASHVQVTLGADDEEVRIVVRDDGRGFDPAEPRTRQSRGLVGMRERAELLGGRLDIESAPGEGTIVRAVIPR